MPKTLRLHIYTDGAAEPNPGPAGIGLVLFGDDGQELARHKHYIGRHTNNEAEYAALIQALRVAPSFCRKEIICYSDSELLMNQMNGAYRVRKRHLLDLFQEVKDCEGAFEAVYYIWVPREDPGLRIADQLSKEAVVRRENPLPVIKL